MMDTGTKPPAGHDDRAAKTLLLPFHSGTLAPPAGRWAFFNATALPAIAELFETTTLVSEQPDRVLFRALQAAGFSAVPSIAAGGPVLDGAMIMLGKHRRVNEASLARAAQLVRPGAPIIVGGARTAGAASLRKWAARHVEIAGSGSKHHGQAFWFGGNRDAFPQAASPQTAPADGFRAAPGMFSADHIDPGSALLAGHIDARICGHVADFGAGWGYLSAMVLRNGRPSAIDLIDTYAPSLEAARQNLAHRAQTASVTMTTHWLDLTAEPAPARYDAIVMNPPFHVARHGVPELGRGFVRAAARALKPKGRLLMVANRTLPYERAVDAHFGQWDCVDERDGYKVIAARRPKI